MSFAPCLCPWARIYATRLHAVTPLSFDVDVRSWGGPWNPVSSKPFSALAVATSAARAMSYADLCVPRPLCGPRPMPTCTCHVRFDAPSIASVLSCRQTCAVMLPSSSRGDAAAFLWCSYPCCVSGLKPSLHSPWPGEVSQLRQRGDRQPTDINSATGLARLVLEAVARSSSSYLLQAGGQLAAGRFASLLPPSRPPTSPRHAPRPRSTTAKTTACLQPPRPLPRPP